MLAAVAALPLLAASASALAFDKRAGPLTSPGALGFVAPPHRGWSSALQNEAACGGYDLNGRTNFPISGGDISLASQRDVYDLRVGYSLSSNPTSNDDFQNLFPNVSVTYIGSSCYTAPDFRTLGAAVGDDVTLQLTFIAGGQNLTFYQCADLTLVEDADFTPYSDYTCKNETTSTQTIPNQAANAASSSAAAAAAATANSDAASSSSSSSSKDAVTPLQAGWIGACVTLAVVALVLIGARFAGVARFGSKSKAASGAHTVAAPDFHRDSASMTSHGSVLKH
ncbi:hypothetical protein JCM6882_002019 [Rhodosporidiobolus microsporus]